MGRKLQLNNHNVCNLGYHIVWIPKYRSHILKGHFKTIVEQSLYVKGKQLGIVIENLEIMEDHVHLFIRTNPSHCLTNVIGQLKGYSSFVLRSTYPWCRKYKSLWAPSYFVESVGHISEETIKKYIENQRSHHG